MRRARSSQSQYSRMLGGPETRSMNRDAVAGEDGGTIGDVMTRFDWGLDWGFGGRGACAQFIPLAAASRAGRVAPAPDHPANPALVPTAPAVPAAAPANPGSHAAR
jgi:hypothetical protein